MKKVTFGNKKGLRILSSKTINIIKKNINDIGTFHLTGKYYNFLNKRNLNCIKPKKFLFTLNSYGKKHVLFLTKIGNKQYCIFINKKNEIMILSQFRFHQDLFSGTLFDGELVKTNNGNWKYLITDIAYYKGINIITKPFNERRVILENIFEKMFANDDKISICHVELKEYFEYRHLKSVCDEYIKKQDYKCSGLLFKNLNNFSDNFLYIFLECRSDNKILNNNQKNKINIQNKGIHNCSKKIKSTENINNINRDYVVFEMRSTNFPDIYELFCKGSNGQKEKHSYACVPNMKKSKFLRKIFKKKEVTGDESDYSSESDLSDVDEDNIIHMKCNYHKNFKKWIPMKKTLEELDNINIINHFELFYENNNK